MAETTKLSVGKALEKLRDTEVPKSRMTRLNEKTDELKEEVRRLRAANDGLPCPKGARAQHGILTGSRRQAVCERLVAGGQGRCFF